jgi:hypothetical protein
MTSLMISCSIRAKIRDGNPEYAVTAHSWPHFVYAGFEAHANDMEKGLLRSALLVKVRLFPINQRETTNGDGLGQAYKHIFTSPTSVAENDSTESAPPAKRLRTGTLAQSKKSNVAMLVQLKEVTPRSIAYIAVQVCPDSLSV